MPILFACNRGTNEYSNDSGSVATTITSDIVDDTAAVLDFVKDTLTGDAFGLIMGNLSPDERTRARGVNKEWRQKITAGAGVPSQLEMPRRSMTRIARCDFLRSQEYMHARTLDFSRGISVADLCELPVNEGIAAVDLRFNPGLNERNCKVIALKFPNIQFLSLHGCNPRALAGLVELSRGAPNLNSLMVSTRLNQGAEHMTEFLQESGAKLEALCIASFPGSDVPGDELINLPTIIARCCPNLKRLALPWHRTLSCDQLELLLKECSQLTEIQISPDQLSTDFVAKKLREYPRIARLTLNYSDVDPAWTTFAEETQAVALEASTLGVRTPRPRHGGSCTEVTLEHGVAPWWTAEMKRHQGE